MGGFGKGLREYVSLNAHPCASGRYFSERGDAVAKASKETHVVSGLSTSLSAEAGWGWGEERGIEVLFVLFMTLHMWGISGHNHCLGKLIWASKTLDPLFLFVCNYGNPISWC